MPCGNGGKCTDAKSDSATCTSPPPATAGEKGAGESCKGGKGAGDSCQHVTK